MNVMLSPVYEMNILNPILIFNNARIHQKDDIQQWSNEIGWDHFSPTAEYN